MSTPSDLIKPFLLQADAEQPSLKTINTAVSCGELLRLTLLKAGPDWAYVGKSVGNGMDGSGVQPAGFMSQDVRCVRPDGQSQTVHIDAVSQDACWHLPTNRQVKVIANSSANDDPNPAIHGPAQLTPYNIDPANYRWHNPLIAVNGSMPAPQPPQPPMPTQPPGREEALDELNWLNGYYKAPEGLQRPQGLSLNGAPDFEGVAAWYLDVYQRERMAMKSRADARAAYVNQIRHSAEWQAKHPGETP